MPRLGVPLLATLCLVAAQAAWSAPPDEPVLSLPALVEEALGANQEILQAQQMWEMAKARPPQEKGLPDPMLQFDLQNTGQR